MAVGRPVITSISPAYKDSLEKTNTIGWVPSGDPRALADTVHDWLKHPHLLADRGRDTRRLFDRYFSMETLKIALNGIIETAFAQSGKHRR